MRKIIALMAVISLTACSGISNIHGSLIKPVEVDKLKIGVHNKYDVQNILGSPSTVSTLNANQWYYITDTMRTKPLKSTQLDKRKLIGITFDKNGILENIFEENETNSREIIPEEKTTKTQGSNLGVLEQIFKNFTGGF